MSLGPKSNFIPVIYAGTRKNKYNKKNGKRKSTRQRSTSSSRKKR